VADDMSAEFYRNMPLCDALTKRALIGCAYWLDCSPHERAEVDAEIVAHYARLAAERIAELEKRVADLSTEGSQLRARPKRFNAAVKKMRDLPKTPEST
jgi:hypothetical protein